MLEINKPPQGINREFTVLQLSLLFLSLSLWDLLQRGCISPLAFIPNFFEQKLKMIIPFAFDRFCHYRISPKPLVQSKPSTAKITRSMQIARRLKSLEVQNIEVVNVDPGILAKFKNILFISFSCITFQFLLVKYDEDTLVHSLLSADSQHKIFVSIPPWS